MKFSVLIPAYNAAKTIRMTLDSVLAQTVTPYEILVFDDGSTDDTVAILESYKPHITVFKQSNHGVAYARNFLCAQAQGDILAFLDADDLWHPCYLKAQKQMIEKCPDAVAYFTDHENILGFGNFRWPVGADSQRINPELIQPVIFVKRLNKTPMSFQMSCCCVSKSALLRLGMEPFCVSGAEDTYFLMMLPLSGPVVCISARFSAYRITERSLSSNQLKVSILVLEALKILEDFYKKKADEELYKVFRAIHVSRRRNCGKFLMGSRQISNARTQFNESLKIAEDPLSLLKSLALLILSYLPATLQPEWPRAIREFKSVTPSRQSF